MVYLGTVADLLETMRRTANADLAALRLGRHASRRQWATWASDRGRSIQLLENEGRDVHVLVKVDNGFIDVSQDVVAVVGIDVIAVEFQYERDVVSRGNDLHSIVDFERDFEIQPAFLLHEVLALERALEIEFPGVLQD